MELPSYFKDFLKEIRPTPDQVEDYKSGHKTLRDRLSKDVKLAPILVSDFLQGSYRRATAIRPKGGKRADVDVIVVTKLSKDEYSPAAAMKLFVPFLDEFYKEKYEFQDRSIAIELSYVDIDLVVTAAPSESEQGILKSDAVRAEDTPEDTTDWRLVKSWVTLEKRRGQFVDEMLKQASKEPEWKTSPLLIPDRETKTWEKTHPLAQIQWTWGKNNRCSGHYVNVVKAVKWSQRIRNPESQYPKGYPLEHIVGVCCPDAITSVAHGVTMTLENVVTRFAGDILAGTVPHLADHGVTEHNVLHRLSMADFKAFYTQISTSAKIARRALDAETVASSARAWIELFGEKFPAPPSDDDGGGGDGTRKAGGYTERTAVSSIAGGRFA
jgi:hypothetical protein